MATHFTVNINRQHLGKISLEESGERYGNRTPYNPTGGMEWVLWRLKQMSESETYI